MFDSDHAVYAVSGVFFPVLCEFVSFGARCWHWHHLRSDADVLLKILGKLTTPIVLMNSTIYIPLTSI